MWMWSVEWWRISWHISVNQSSPSDSTTPSWPPLVTSYLAVFLSLLQHSFTRLDIRCLWAVLFLCVYVLFHLQTPPMVMLDAGSDEDVLAGLLEAIAELPPCNKDTLAYLILHLQRLDHQSNTIVVYITSLSSCLKALLLSLQLVYRMFHSVMRFALLLLRPQCTNSHTMLYRWDCWSSQV